MKSEGMPLNAADIAVVPICGDAFVPVQLHGMLQKEFCAEDFRLVKAIGNGDMGTVFLVVHKSTNTPYAMKVTRTDALISKKTRAIRAQTEKHILSLLQHPFLPSLLTSFESSKHLFLVMDYCAGGDLNILRQRQPDKIFSVDVARFYAAEVVLALEYLHKMGILYRDLKPENVLVRADGHIMLTDFDLSLRVSQRKSFVKEVRVPETKERHSQIKALFVCGAGGNRKRAPTGSILSRVTPVEATNLRKGGNDETQALQTEPRSNSFVGTVEYVAPEILLGSGHSWQVDWWTLGIFLFEMVSGRTPFKSENNRKETFYNIVTKAPEIPGPMRPLKDLLQKLLIKEPTERLGNNGADEIKNHPFFDGVQWDSLQFICRPPCLPLPLVIAEIDAEVDKIKRTARSHEQSEGEFEREQMQREAFGNLSTYSELSKNLGTDPAVSQQEDETPLPMLPAEATVSIEKQSGWGSSLITSSQSWNGSDSVAERSTKIWSKSDGNQSSAEEEETRSVCGINKHQVLKHIMRRDSEPAEMIKYF